MEYKKITYFFNFLLNQMKLFSIYLFCIALLTYHGLSMANNIKKDLLNQSNSINQAVTSYSQYLQTLNWLIMNVFISSEYSEDVASLGIEYLECNNSNIIEISKKDYFYIINNFGNVI